MLPAYFLSILFNALVGYILVFGYDDIEAEGWSFSLNNEKTRLVIGVIAFITGILKILSPVEGNVPVVGDLLPALSGFIGGSILVLDFYRKKSHTNTVETDSYDMDSADDYADVQAPKRNIFKRIAALPGKNRKIMGFVCFAAAVLHLYFYPVLFL
jgi:hypothetical protein